jgi:hypothetical protein
MFTMISSLGIMWSQATQSSVLLMVRNISAVFPSQVDELMELSLVGPARHCETNPGLNYKGSNHFLPYDVVL